jgi:hypothetical protein
VAARLVRAVEGVVDVDFEPEGEHSPSDSAGAPPAGARWAGRP